MSTEILTHLEERLVAEHPDLITGHAIAYDELNITATADHIIDLIIALRDEYSFTQLIDLCGVDWPEREKRFDIVYHMLSITRNARLRIKVPLAEGEHIPSVTRIHPGAEWYEREAYDMFGMVFDGHPDFRRILTDYDFEGFPLRKDFPLTGYVEVSYDDSKKQVVYKPVHLTQDYRDFDFTSPWEGPAKVRGNE